FQAADALELPHRLTLGLAGVVERTVHVIAVPPPEVERDAAERGQRAPVAPHGGIFGVRIVLAECSDRDVFRIEPFDQLVDRLGASRGRDACDDDSYGELRELAGIDLRGEQVVAQCWHEAAIVASAPVHLPAGTCCVMQWILPPPSRISRACTPMIRRSGKMRVSMRIA